ncbi:MAG: riboflavin synthase, partial [Nitrospira sp.]
MFAGIVEEMGAVKSLEKTVAGTRLTILARLVLDDLPIGASISVNGACLTIVKRDEKEFAADVSSET